MSTNLIDPIHSSIDAFGMDLIADVWKNKYRWMNETSILDTIERVIQGVYANDTSTQAREQMRIFMRLGLWMPAGRILAGAGTSKTVTLMNCYVNDTVDDSMQGIHKALGNTMFTLQQGGGIGTDFSTLRPNTAALKRTGPGSAASGPIPFMHMWDAASQTVKSAGDRRGAMMGTISDTHPDLPAFIEAKQTPGVMTQFNVSILVSDAFMQAVANDHEWLLYFPHPPTGGRNLEMISRDFKDPTGRIQYVYSAWRARDLWDKIMRSTYDYAEPGVIFIDRVNELNNLNYCEYIRCTNPCGEQPLPPNGACNLGAINLARLVHDPFTEKAWIDNTLLKRVVVAAVRFLDNVIDVSQYPLPEQAEEQRNKRRLGLGISGLADCLAQMGLVYGSEESVRFTNSIMKTIATTAYTASAYLATGRGRFPLYNEELFLSAPFLQKMPENVRSLINTQGIRNGLLLTIAPVGSTSLIYGNISSGLEPNFAHSYNRKIFSSNNEHQAETYEQVTSYTYRLHKAWCAASGKDVSDYDETWMPEAVRITAQELEVSAHLKIQAACQEWVDASISKTINVPSHYSFEHFKAIYQEAYEMGCKGCTTYRPNPDSGRGSVLEVSASSAAEQETSAEIAEVAASETTPIMQMRERAQSMQGVTYKFKWPSWSAAIYVTINHDEDGIPFEIFIMSKDSRFQEWMTALTVMISANMRRGDYLWIPEELKAIHSVGDGAWHNGKYYGSILARIGQTIEDHFDSIGLNEGIEAIPPGTYNAKFASVRVIDDDTVHVKYDIQGESCSQCQAPAVTMQEGCKKCGSCGHSECG